MAGSALIQHEKMIDAKSFAGIHCLMKLGIFFPQHEKCCHHPLKHLINPLADITGIDEILTVCFDGVRRGIRILFAKDLFNRFRRVLLFQEGKELLGGTQHERDRIGLQLAAHGAEWTFTVLVETIHHRYGVNLFFYIDPILSIV